MDISGLMQAVQGLQGEDAFPARLSHADWQVLARAMDRRELGTGDLLMRRGDTDTHAYLIEQGQLQVFVTGGAPRSHRIATLPAGSLVGEPGLFGAVPRMAHVEALGPTVVWAMGAQKLHTLATEAPALVLEVMRAAGAVMALRMRAHLERGIPVT